MYSVAELKQQNQDICQLCDVLSPLMENAALHDNPYVCELMTRFKEKVWMHLVFEDNTVYAELARHPDSDINEVAQKFHDSAREIKHRFSMYVKHWCKPARSEADHEVLRDESREIFRMVRERVAYENEQMFPLIETSSAA